MGKIRVGAKPRFILKPKKISIGSQSPNKQNMSFAEMIKNKDNHKINEKMGENYTREIVKAKDIKK